MKESKDTIFIIDFDSTFIQTESLDELAAIILKKKRNKEKILSEIKAITDAGMNGTVSFRESLTKRLTILAPDRKHVRELAELLKKKVTPSVRRNREFFRTHADSIYIISGGFREFILPVVRQYGINPDHVLANTFQFTATGKYAGFDTSNPLSKSGGKAAAVSGLKIGKKYIIVGDGYTDYEIAQKQSESTFVAFTENIRRISMVAKADHVAPSFDEVLYLFGYKTAVSYPKNRIRVLLLENIQSSAAESFEKEGYSVETEQKSLSGDELMRRLKGVSVLGIRSRTKIDGEVLRSNPRLLAIGAYCIGTDQIALQDSAEQGIAVFNAPYSNSRSVVELVLGEIIMLARGVMTKNMQLHDGIWNKSAQGSFEVRGKTLGIIGYGNIGSQLSVLAEAVGMNVIFYDIQEKLPLGNSRQVFDLRHLLRLSDIISIHVDGRKSNTGFIGMEEFKRMKKGVLFVNASRGQIVDTDALAAAVKSNHVAAAAVDVFPHEPAHSSEPFTSVLRGLKNVILTPHIGGSTREAQINIARFVSTKLMEYLNTGSTVLSVNMPNITVPHTKGIHRFLHIHHNVPGMLAAINSVFAKHSINIVDQVLKTNESVGYVATDVKKGYENTVNKALAEIPNTIRSRSIYL